MSELNDKYPPKPCVRLKPAKCTGMGTRVEVEGINPFSLIEYRCEVCGMEWIPRF